MSDSGIGKQTLLVEHGDTANTATLRFNKKLGDMGIKVLAAINPARPHCSSHCPPPHPRPARLPRFLLACVHAQSWNACVKPGVRQSTLTGAPVPQMSQAGLQGIATGVANQIKAKNAKADKTGL